MLIVGQDLTSSLPLLSNRKYPINSNRVICEKAKDDPLSQLTKSCGMLVKYSFFVLFLMTSATVPMTCASSDRSQNLLDSVRTRASLLWPRKAANKFFTALLFSTTFFQSEIHMNLLSLPSCWKVVERLTVLVPMEVSKSTLKSDLRLRLQGLLCPLQLQSATRIQRHICPTPVRKKWSRAVRFIWFIKNGSHQQHDAYCACRSIRSVDLVKFACWNELAVYNSLIRRHPLFCTSHEHHQLPCRMYHKKTEIKRWHSAFINSRNYLVVTYLLPLWFRLLQNHQEFTTLFKQKHDCHKIQLSSRSKSQTVTL